MHGAAAAGVSAQAARSAADSGQPAGPHTESAVGLRVLEVKKEEKSDIQFQFSEFPGGRPVKCRCLMHNNGTARCCRGTALLCPKR